MAGSSDDVSTLLSQAVEAHKSGDLATALAHLVSAWRLCPAAALKRAVFALDPLPTAPPPMTTPDWLKAAKEAPASQRSALLATLQTKLLDHTCDRIRACQAWGPDPRCSRAIDGFFAQVPFTSNSSRFVWEALFQLLVEQQDPDFVVRQKEIVDSWKIRSAQRNWMIEQFSAALARLPLSMPDLSSKQTELVESLVTASLGKSKGKPAKASERVTTNDLLEAIWANPDDDAPRLVYADWLEEQGNPRGEFIRLQFKADKTAAESRRESSLLKQHLTEWLGPLAPALKGGCQFARGFPVSAQIKCRNRLEVDKVKDLPDWSTFRELVWTTTWWPKKRELFFLGPQMRCLRSATGAALECLLETKRVWALEELKLEQTPFEPATWAEVLRQGILPKLKSLSCQPATAKVLQDVKSWGPVEKLGVSLNEHPIRDRKGLFEVLLGLGETTQLSVVEFAHYGPSLSIARGADGRLSRLTVEERSDGYLADLPASSMTSVEMVDEDQLSPDGQENFKLQRKRLLKR